LVPPGSKTTLKKNTIENAVPAIDSLINGESGIPPTLREMATTAAAATREAIPGIAMEEKKSLV